MRVLHLQQHDRNLSKISQTEKRQILYNLTYMENFKATNPQTYRYREHIGSCQRWRVRDGEKEPRKSKGKNFQL